jgi:hypothetical protein
VVLFGGRCARGRMAAGRPVNGGAVWRDAKQIRLTSGFRYACGWKTRSLMGGIQFSARHVSFVGMPRGNASLGVWAVNESKDRPKCATYMQSGLWIAEDVNSKSMMFMSKSVYRLTSPTPLWGGVRGGVAVEFPRHVQI